MDFLLGDVSAQLELLMQIAIAMTLGGIVGLEREMSAKPAGLRTHMLVAGAAALFIGLADILALKFAHAPYADALRIEPIRIIGAIITGISFLGAGTIFRDRRGTVEGLTTAASILMVSAIGIAVALDRDLLATSVTALVLLVLILVRMVERLFTRA